MDNHSHPHHPHSCLFVFLPIIRCATLCLELPKTHSMRGVRNHVSELKRNTACTTDLNNIPDTIGSAPFQASILVRCAQLFYVFFNFTTTTGQFSSPDVKTRPRYLNKVTVSSGLP